VIVDAARDKEIRSFGEHSGGIEGVAYQPDGRWVATPLPMDSEDLNETPEIAAHARRPHGPVLHVVYSLTDGGSPRGLEQNGKDLERQTGQRLSPAGTHDVVSMVAFSRNGHFLASASYNGTRIWNATPVNDITTRSPLTFRAHERRQERRFHSRRPTPGVCRF